jgi:hypothetical protein
MAAEETGSAEKSGDAKGDAKEDSGAELIHTVVLHATLILKP